MQEIDLYIYTYIVQLIYRYLKLLNEVRKEQKFIEKLKPYGYLFKYISENTGANVKTSHELYETYNQLVAQV